MTRKRETPLWRRYSRLWGPDPVRDIDDELDFHFDMRVRDLMQEGMSEGAARERAAAEFGSVTNVRAQMTEIGTRRVKHERRTRSVEGLIADMRYAVRHFRRTPLSTITMILVLSLGIGTNVVLFTVMNSLATMPAPGIARNEALVRIRGTMRLERVLGEHRRLLSWPEVQEYAARTDLFNSVGAHADATAVIHTGDAEAAPITASVVYATPNYFSILDVRPALGNEPAAEQNVMQLTTSPGAVISYAMWQRHFGGTRDIIGRTIRVNDVPVEIVGVAPPRFIGTGGTGAMTLWVPLAAYPTLEKRSAAAFISNDSMFLSASARLRPGVTTKHATPIVAGIAQRVFQPARSDAATSPARGEVTSARVETGSADVVPMLAMNHRVSDRAETLISATASSAFALLVLLITCTNVSALMVGLAVARRREIGVRLSLGAPRARLIRQLLTESVLLALIAAAVGLFVTTLGIRLIGTALEDVQLVIDWRVTLATCAVAIVTGILFGLSPALHATRVGVAEVLKSSATAVAAKRSKLQHALVVAQITLTQPLLVGLGVVIFTLITDMGSRTTSDVREYIAEIELDTWAGNASSAERAARIAAVVERVAAVPGVTIALPMEMGTATMHMTVHPDDRVNGITYDTDMQMRMVAAPKGYFDAYAIPIVLGRDFDTDEYALPQETTDSARESLGAVQRAIASLDAVIIGSDLARRLWGDANPLGRRLVGASAAGPATQAPPLVVVGVVDAAAAGPSEINNNLIRAFVPYATINTGVIARTAGPASPLLEDLRSVVAAEAPHMPVYRAQTMGQREAEFKRNVLRASSAIAGGGLLALLLSAIGLYAVVSFAVGQRTREIGIRTSLGANQSQVVRMFFLSGLALSAFGLILGLPLSIIVTRIIVSTLNWPLSSSPLLGVAIGLVVLAVASLAVWIPARRASTIDPLVALRTE
jgi:putative ABC transport system permease protein